MPEDNYILIIVMVVCLAAVVPGWLLAQESFLTARWKILTPVVVLIFTAALAAIAFVIPFMVGRDKAVAATAPLIDLLLFGVFPLGVLALIGFVRDRLADQPKSTWLAFAAGACFSISALPIAYYLYANEMFERFNITIEPVVASVFLF